MSFTFSLDQSFLLLNRLVLSALPITSDAASDLIRINCFPEWYSHITLQWTIPDSWGNCKFNVYFSPGGDSESILLNSTLLSNPHFRDDTSREYSKFSDGGYVVEVIFPGSSRTVKSKSTFAQYKRRDRTSRIAAEIQRREYMLLSKFAGAKAYFFRKKNYGVRCTRCWSKIEEKVMDDHCGVCYGTSWEGGYFDPLPIFMQFEPSPSSTVKGYSGDMEPNAIGAWTISLPEIHSGDVIIRTGDFFVYKVITSSPTELQTRPVRQMLALTQLSKSDVENALSNRMENDGAYSYITEIGGRFNPQRFPTNLIDKVPENDYKWTESQKLETLPKYDI